MKNIVSFARPSLVLGLLALASISIVSIHGAVANVALLQGSQLENGARELTSSGFRSILWAEKSSIDPTVFDHSFDNATKLTVKKDGDYLVSVTVPLISIDTTDNRPSQIIEVFVNGGRAPGTVGQSSYIRNQPRNANMHQESSNHVNALLTGLQENDVIEVKIQKHSQAAQATAMQSASVYVEFIESSRTVFAALASGPTNGTNLNADFFGAFDPPAELAWTSTRKDAGFDHADGSSGIGLSAGTYLVFVNVPMTSAIARASTGLEVVLNGAPVPGGLARQGYIRNSGGHSRASVHWSGLVQITGNQTLTIQTLQLALPGVVTLQRGRQASVYIEKIDDSSGVFFTNSFFVDDLNDPFDWNPAEKTDVIWESPEFISDSRMFSRGAGNTQIQVRQAGSYLLVYNDALQSTGARVNPKITVEVNGRVVPGAETKTHYIRSSDGHNHSSASLVFLLEGLESNDAITVTTQREGNTQNVVQDEFSNEAAILALIRKDALIIPSDFDLPPRLSSFSGDSLGFEAKFQSFTVGIDPASVQGVLDGEAVNVQTSTENSVTTLSYFVPAGEVLKGDHTLKLSYSDTATPPSSDQKEFTWTTFSGQTDVLLDLLIDPDNPGIAYWQFDEIRRTVANEEIGNAPNGIYSRAGRGRLPQLGAPPLVPNTGGSSVGFDRDEGSHITIADHADINDGGPYLERSISFWFQSRNLPETGDYQVLFEEGGLTRGISIYLFGTQSGEPAEAELYMGAWNRGEEIWGGVEGNPVDVDGNPLEPNDSPLFLHATIQKDQVYNAVFVMQGDDSAPDSFNGTITGYLNGESIGDPAVGVHLLYGHTDDIGIAAMNGNVVFHNQVIDANFAPDIPQPNHFFFDGFIDNFAMFDSALSAERVKAHYDGAFVIDVPAVDPEITSVKFVGGIIELEYMGILTSSENVEGPYSPVPGANSPFSKLANKNAEFFRVEQVTGSP